MFVVQIKFYSLLLLLCLFLYSPLKIIHRTAFVNTFPMKWWVVSRNNKRHLNFLVFFIEFWFYALFTIFLPLHISKAYEHINKSRYGNESCFMIHKRNAIGAELLLLLLKYKNRQNKFCTTTIKCFLNYSLEIQEDCDD